MPMPDANTAESQSYFALMKEGVANFTAQQAERVRQQLQQILHFFGEAALPFATEMAKEYGFRIGASATGGYAVFLAAPYAAPYAAPAAATVAAWFGVSAAAVATGGAILFGVGVVGALYRYTPTAVSGCKRMIEFLRERLTNLSVTLQGMLISETESNKDLANIKENLGKTKTDLETSKETIKEVEDKKIPELKESIKKLETSVAIDEKNLKVVSDDVKLLQQKSAEQKQEITSLQEGLAEKNTQVSDLLAKNKVLEEKTKAAGKRKQELKEKLERHKQRLRKANQCIAQLNDQLRNAREKIAALEEIQQTMANKLAELEGQNEALMSMATKVFDFVKKKLEFLNALEGHPGEVLAYSLALIAGFVALGPVFAVAGFSMAGVAGASAGGGALTLVQFATKLNEAKDRLKENQGEMKGLLAKSKGNDQALLDLQSELEALGKSLVDEKKAFEALILNDSEEQLTLHPGRAVSFYQSEFDDGTVDELAAVQQAFVIAKQGATT